MIKKLTKDAIKAIVGGAVRAGINGPRPISKGMAYLLSVQDDRRRIATRTGAITIRTGNPLEGYRADSFFTKEPETIAWMDNTISPDSVFYDVGANIGLYSLYATHLHPGKTQAVAFEPEALNFARLNQNVADNGLSDQVLCLCLGLGASDAVIDFPLADMVPGRALHGTAHVKAGAHVHRQGMVVLTLDGLLAENPNMAPPTHLKIDVDGPELDIVRGARETLRSPSLRHALIETASDNHDAIVALLTEAGFSETGAGIAFEGMANHIFIKA